MTTANMIDVLFFVGVFTCIGCGANILFASSEDWKVELAWIIGGAVGVGTIIAAILLNSKGC